jgi:hypothetical protein
MDTEQGIEVVEQDAKGKGKAASAAPSNGKRFEIKKWNAVAMWSWAICTDTCAICRNNLYEPSIEYQVWAVPLQHWLAQHMQSIPIPIPAHPICLACSQAAEGSQAKWSFTGRRDCCMQRLACTLGWPGLQPAGTASQSTPLRAVLEAS